MVPYITVPLGDQKSGWLSKHVSKMSDPTESLPLLKPSASSLIGIS